MQFREYSYHTKEIQCDNSGKKIYGVAYIPYSHEERKPLVIFSHELGNSHRTGIPYARRLVKKGFAVYTFDFCGGSAGGNKSDGSSVEMSIMTEVSDLEAVLYAASGWDFVDPERIILFGGSQGGVASVLAGSRNQDKVAAMILIYPALSAVDDTHSHFDSINDIPKEFDMFGGWMHVGRNYAADIWDLDLYKPLAAYQGPVLLLHGDSDTTVDISYSERAAEVIPDCEYHVISGGGHMFIRSYFDEAVKYILDFLKRFDSQ